MYVPGREQTVPDAMNRAPIKSTGDSSVSFLIQEVDSYCLGMINSLPITDIQLEKLRGDQHSDEVLNNIMAYCSSEWPLKHHLSPSKQLYFSVKDDLCVLDDILFKGSRLVIPTSMREEMLKRIHIGHQSLSKAMTRVRHSIW